MFQGYVGKLGGERESDFGTPGSTTCIRGKESMGDEVEKSYSVLLESSGLFHRT